MKIRLKCECGKILSADESLAGKVVKCPSCGNEVTIPRTKTAGVSGGKEYTAALNIGLVLLGVAIVMIGIGSWMLLKTWIVRSTWKRVKATITHTELRKAGPHSGPQQFSVRIKYNYNVAGKEYHSERFGFFGVSYPGRALGPYKVGKTVTVYCNPKDPAQAVAYLKVPHLAIILLAIGVFVSGFGGLMAGSVIWYRRKMKKSENAQL